MQVPLSSLSYKQSHINELLVDSERLLHLFQQTPQIQDAPGAQPLQFVKGKIEFKNVSFAYEDRDSTLKDINFVVPAGKTIALVGETGGGKSTILKLLNRFYDVKAGGVEIDGQDLRNITLAR